MGTTAEKLEYLSDTKELIRLAIIEKGVQVDTSDTFRSYRKTESRTYSTSKQVLVGIIFQI